MGKTVGQKYCYQTPVTHTTLKSSLGFHKELDRFGMRITCLCLSFHGTCIDINIEYKILRNRKNTFFSLIIPWIPLKLEVIPYAYPRYICFLACFLRELSTYWVKSANVAVTSEIKREKTHPPCAYTYIKSSPMILTWMLD